MFDALNWKYWGGMLPVIELIGSKNFESCGEYLSPKNEGSVCYENYRITIKISMSAKEQRETLLHEMCHHSCFLKNKEKYWNNEIKWHGPEWQGEMKRVGFKGKITRYT